MMKKQLGTVPSSRDILKQMLALASVRVVVTSEFVIILSTNSINQGYRDKDMNYTASCGCETSAYRFLPDDL